MARDTADFVQQSSERAMQAANFGTTWGREFAEESFNQSRQAVDAFLRVSRKMAEDFETQATAIREHMTSLTQKTMSNTMEFGQKLASVKEPQEFAQCQSEFMARQAQTIADQNVRSHTFHFVTPSDTETLKIPNACNECHKDKSIEWAKTALESWSDRSPWRMSR